MDFLSRILYTIRKGRKKYKAIGNTAESNNTMRIRIKSNVQFLKTLFIFKSKINSAKRIKSIVIQNLFIRNSFFILKNRRKISKKQSL